MTDIVVTAIFTSFTTAFLVVFVSFFRMEKLFYEMLKDYDDLCKKQLTETSEIIKKHYRENN